MTDGSRDDSDESVMTPMMSRHDKITTHSSLGRWRHTISSAFPCLARAGKRHGLTKPAVSLQFSLVLSLLMIMENMLVLFDDVMRRKDQAGSGSFKGFS
jgi:hypothetical protein